MFCVTPSPKTLFILGAGSYASPLIELARECGYLVGGLYDDNEQTSNVDSIQKLGTIKDLKSDEICNKNFAVSIGNNTIRQKIMTMIIRAGGHVPSLIHPKAVISPSAQIGQGCYIQPGAVIWSHVKLRDFCIVSPNAVIAHHVQTGSACLFSTLSAIGANITLGNRNFFGIHAVAMTGITSIGDDNIVGAGAVVISNVGNHNTLVGVPAKPVFKHKS